MTINVTICRQSRGPVQEFGPAASAKAAITIGILAEGQNVPLVALLTLYWKKCDNGIMLGMIVGVFSAVALVLVSPNMTHPLQVKAALEKVINAN